MLHYIRQNIGVFYVDKEWRDRVWDMILETLPPACITRRVCNKNEMFIHLVDSSIIRFIKVNENCRGVKVDKALVDPSIDWDDYCCRVKTAMVGGMKYEPFTYEEGRVIPFRHITDC